RCVHRRAGFRFAGRESRRSGGRWRLFGGDEKCPRKRHRRREPVSRHSPSMTNKTPVSVIVPIKNEAENLPRCLSSVQWADEIFVIDSQSGDGSPAIAEKLGAKVVQFQFNGTWPKKKNWALEHLPFKNEWVFILDADEVL